MRKKEIEIWTPVYEFEEFYEVSTLGRVRSLNRFFIDKLNREHTIEGRILKPRKSTKKYLSVALYDKYHKRVNRGIHMCVLYSFKGFKDLQINHKDLNKSNNRLDNLEYMNCRQNIIHFWRTKKRSSKFIGVYKTANKCENWTSSITVNGKGKFLGNYDTEILAFIARLKYEIYLYSIGELK